eukprot:1873956-Rhodomonas_salina.1
MLTLLFGEQGLVRRLSESAMKLEKAKEEASAAQEAYAHRLKLAVLKLEAVSAQSRDDDVAMMMMMMMMMMRRRRRRDEKEKEG